MFFELTNILTTCQKLFNQILGTTLNDFAIMNFNDIFIDSEIKNQHIKYV